MVFQHVAHEPLGTLLPLLKRAGFRIRFVNFGRHPDFVPDLKGYSGLIVLGGPMGVYEAPRIPHLRAEQKAIENALKMNIPVLGICLGAQLIASVLGSSVNPAPGWELGWYKLNLTDHGPADALLKHYDSSNHVFQMHQDMFEPPKTAAHLATTDTCEGQAFRYGDKVYGFQFHLEADRAMILRWLSRPEHRKVILDSAGKFSAEKIEADTNRLIESSLKLSEKTFAEFINIFQLPDRHLILGSR